MSDQEGVRLPITPDFQGTLLRELCANKVLAVEMMPHLRPGYFDGEMHAWAFGAMQAYEARYGTTPGWEQMPSFARNLPAAEAQNYQATLRAIGERPALDGAAKRWLSDQVLEFIRDRHFVQACNQVTAMHGRGQQTEARELMIAKMAQLASLSMARRDRTFFFEDLDARQRQRIASRDDPFSAITTGLPTLDRMLSGPTAKVVGMRKGWLGLWQAYPKGGKSTVLVRHGVAAVRAMARVLHIVAEGKREETEDRYEANFLQVDSQQVRSGQIPKDRLEAIEREYAELRGRLVLRGYTLEENSWEISTSDVVRELQFLKTAHDFVPDVIIVDYADLLTGRDKSYRSATERQSAVYRDLKTLAQSDPGYVIWTASQPQRAEADADIKPHLIKSGMIADAVNKIRIADFLGSVNSTLTERDQKLARLYFELCRHAPMDHEITVRADFTTMTILEQPGLRSPHQETASSAMRALGDLGGRRPRGPKQQRAF